MTSFKNKIFKKIKMPKHNSFEEMKIFFKKKNINIEKNFKFVARENYKLNNNTYGPEIEDLYRIYNIIVLNKRTTVLEFGTGWSTLVTTRALYDLKKKYFNQASKLRRNNLFELFVIDDYKKYLNYSKKRIQTHKELKTIKIHWKYSPIVLETYNGQFSTSYKNLHLCNPDFIYIDGPDLFSDVKGYVQNFTTKHLDMMPMINDILKFENFLNPGTIILTDGRAANALFLKNNFKRNWLYYFDVKYDQHFFYLDDKPFGKINKQLLNFYSSK